MQFFARAASRQLTLINVGSVMKRDLAARFLIEGVSPDIKKQLRESAMNLYGQPNASLLVRQLINDHLEKTKKNPISLISVDDESDTVRVEIRLPRSIVKILDEKAESRLSKRNYYISSIIFSHLGKTQLQGDEIEVLRRSNYELSKIGTNLNQIAKAFNLLVIDNRDDERVPEMGKKLASLRREIKQHINKVLKVLNAGTALLERKFNK